MNSEELTPNVEAEETANVAPETQSETRASRKNEAHDDFDWDADEAGFQSYSSTEKDKLSKVYSESFTPVVEKQIVKGKVTSISDREVVINIGFKSDGLVNRQ